MRKTILVLGCVLFFFVALLPLGTLLTSCFGCLFQLASVPAFAAVTALLSVCLVMISLTAKEAAISGAVQVLFALLSPLSLISGFLCILERSSLLIVVCVVICIGCCIFLNVKNGKPLALKIIASVLSVVLILPIGFFGFIALIFGGVSENTVVKTVESPTGAYYAQVIDSDQGALGGDTFVDVYEDVFDALIFKITKKPKRVYQGDWGAFQNMQIYWDSDDCLVINSVQYVME